MDYPVLVRPGKPSWGMMANVNAKQCFEKTFRPTKKNAGSPDSRPDLPLKEANGKENQETGIRPGETQQTRGTPQSLAAYLCFRAAARRRLHRSQKAQEEA